MLRAQSSRQYQKHLKPGAGFVVNVLRNSWDDNIAIRSANTVIVQSYVVALRINKGLAAVSRGSGIPVNNKFDPS